MRVNGTRVLGVKPKKQHLLVDFPQISYSYGIGANRELLDLNPILFFNDSKLERSKSFWYVKVIKHWTSASFLFRSKPRFLLGFCSRRNVANEWALLTFRIWSFSIVQMCFCTSKCGHRKLLHAVISVGLIL